MENKRTVDELAEEINALTPLEKLILMRRLKESKVKGRHEKKEAYNLTGEFIPEKSAEEIIREIYESRSYGREIESLDE